MRMGGMINGQNMMNDQGMMGMMAQNMVGIWTPPAELAPEGNTLTADEAATIAEAYITTSRQEHPEHPRRYGR